MPPLFQNGSFGGAYMYIRKGFYLDGNLPFQIDWASLIDGRKFTVFALFYFVFVANFPSASSHGSYIFFAIPL